MARAALRPLLLLLLALLTAAPAAAQDSPRAAVHDGYGRMVFDWPAPVSYSAEVAGDRLVVRFSRKPSGDPRDVLRPLSAYLRSFEASADGRTLSFGLARSVTPRAFLVGSSVVIDLVDRPARAEPPPPAEARPAPPPPPPAAPADLAAVPVRTGEHTGFLRLVFDWPRPVEYRVAKDGDSVTVTFARPGRLDAARLRSALPADVGLLRAGSDDKATSLTLSLPKGARLRHFRSGPGVVVDVVRPADGAPPPTVEGKPAPVPLAPPPEAAEPQPAVAPSRPPQPAPKPPAEIVEEMRAAAPVAPPPEAATTITLDWPRPTAAAAFRRAGWLWLVFDAPQQVDLAALRAGAGDAVVHAEQVPHEAATVLRLITRPDVNPGLRRDGLRWFVDLSRRPMRPATAIEVQRHVADGLASLFMPVSEGGAVFALQDPEVGDMLRVVPVVPLGHGVYPGGDLPEVEVPVTAQGVVVVPRADGVDVTSTRTGVAVTAPDGLSVDVVGQGVDAEQRLGDEAPAATAAPSFDPGGWLQPGPQYYRARRAVLEEQLGLTPRGNRNPLRLDLARLHLANAAAAEALSILRVMADEEPSVADAAAFRAVRGAGQLLMGRPDEAVADLAAAAAEAGAEAAFWAAAAKARLNRPADQAGILQAGLPLLRKYHPEIKVRLGMIAAEALIDAAAEAEADADADEAPVEDERLSLAADLIETLRRERLTRSEKAHLRWLEARLAKVNGDFDQAIALWQEVEAGNDRLYRARAALDRIELELAQQRIDAAEAIRRMDRLRFAWRGDDLEFDLLRRLGELRIEAGDYGEGLRSLRQLATTFSGHPKMDAVSELMTGTFERLFLDGGADALPPVTAIALYEEFRELTPAGPKGDEMIRRLADRLATVDLLDQAAKLLRHQVDYRLQGEDKARVAARLALIYLLDRKPEEALAVIETSDRPQLPDLLQAQRRQLRAQALSDLGRAAEAVALIEGDQTRSARLLRAEIRWREQNWEDAAAAFADLVGEPAPGTPLDAESARFVLHWATALTLAGDDEGVSALRNRFGVPMAQSPYRDAFSLLTSAAGGSIADYRRVPDEIRKAERFQAFMSAYRERLQAEGLSAIN